MPQTTAFSFRAFLFVLRKENLILGICRSSRFSVSEKRVAAHSAISKGLGIPNKRR